MLLKFSFSLQILRFATDIRNTHIYTQRYNQLHSSDSENIQVQKSMPIYIIIYFESFMLAYTP